MSNEVMNCGKPRLSKFACCFRVRSSRVLRASFRVLIFTSHVSVQCLRSGRAVGVFRIGELLFLSFNIFGSFSRSRKIQNLLNSLNSDTAAAIVLNALRTNRGLQKSHHNHVAASDSAWGGGGTVSGPQRTHHIQLKHEEKGFKKPTRNAKFFS